MKHWRSSNSKWCGSTIGVSLSPTGLPGHNSSNSSFFLPLQSKPDGVVCQSAELSNPELHHLDASGIWGQILHCCRETLSLRGCLEASLVSTHYASDINSFFQSFDNQSVSYYFLMNWVRGGQSKWLNWKPLFPCSNPCCILAAPGNSKALTTSQ